MHKFIIAGDVKPGDCVEILGQDARHISRVLRFKPKDKLSLTNGQGQDFTGQIITVRPDIVTVRLVEKLSVQTESDLELTLCTAMLKHKKMDEIIRQATQLGVTRWIPFYSSRSIPAPNPKKEARQIERWQSIAVESLKQCQRSRLVQIHGPMSFAEALTRVDAHTHKIAFWEHGSLPLNALEGKDEPLSAAVLIGPEGGFQADEIQLTRTHGFRTYTMGPRILRAETAAVWAAGVVQYLLGDMGGKPSILT